MRPQHYIRSILPEGPVGLTGAFRCADQLLEVIEKNTLITLLTEPRKKQYLFCEIYEIMSLFKVVLFAAGKRDITDRHVSPRSSQHPQKGELTE